MSRENLHIRIDELLGALSINNNRLSLHEERVSQLDIDVLRKNCIELYENINLLALEKKQIVKKAKKTKSKKAAKPKKVVEPEVIQEIEETEVQVEIEEVVKPTPKKKAFVQPKKKRQEVDEGEKSYLFQRFSSKPIKSIAKSISLVKKFEFQKSFFEGDGEAYKRFIYALDNANNREEAFEVYHSTKAKYSWDNEDLRDELKALMYRKFS